MSKREIFPVENERIVLRLLEMADLSLTLSWRNRDDIRKWFINTDIISKENHHAWFKHYSELDNDFVFVILAKDLDNICVGQISLYKIDWDNKSAEFGRLMIGNQLARGKGYAKEATLLLLDYGFRKMGLKEIHLEVRAENKPAISVYKAAGFVELTRDDGLVYMVARMET